MKKITDEQQALWSDIVQLEREIWETFSNKPRRPICNEDWTDAHQEYLEYTWYVDELDARYQDAQKKWFEAMGYTDRKIRTASEYYKKQKDFEETVAYYKEHHINGM